MTTIYVEKDLWKRLNILKKPGDSMGKIIENLLDYYEQHEEETNVEYLSDEEFKELLDDLHIPDEEFEKYLEKTRETHGRREK